MRKINGLIATSAKKVFRFFSSLKTAIPLLVVTIVVTIVISMMPTTDLFRSWWYLGLLGLNGISLLFITILHIPLILERKGRNALIGVVATHLGILILIAGAIYGAMSGFRHEVRAIEDEITIVPGLPFAIFLEKMIVEEYPAGTFPEGSAQSNLKKRQDSHISILVNGQKQASFVIGPGNPARFEGTMILPALNEIGWYFELISTDLQGRPKTIPVKPWAPPIFVVGNTQIMAHSRLEGNALSAELFTMVDGQVTPLGVVGGNEELSVEGHVLSLGNVKRYTGLSIYNRPHAPVLIAGCLAMMFGLIWHFYFRYRDRKKVSE
jgi:cytochrome c biogenesis protein ResB